MFVGCNLFVGVRVIDVWGRGNVFFCEIVGAVVDKIVYKIVVCGVCGGVCVIRRSAVVDKIVYKIVVCRVVFNIYRVIDSDIVDGIVVGVWFLVESCDRHRDDSGASHDASGDEIDDVPREVYGEDESAGASE